MAIRGPRMDPTVMDCAIEATYEKGRHEAWGSNQKVTDQVSCLLTTLRLITDRNLYLAFTKSTSNSFLEPGGVTSSSLRPRRLTTEAHIDQSMEQQIVDTWHRIRSLPTGSRTKLALRRWDIVSERWDQDDALIDYWIALESLFVPDSTQELKYRASLRIATFIGETPGERKAAYKDLRDSYDLRSKIVHGVPKADEENKAHVISKTRSYLRRALLSVLSSKDAFDPESIELQLLST